MDSQLVLFRRQYLQLFEPEFIAWPPRALLRDAALQAWIYTHCFDSEMNANLPPERYQLRILKPLLARVEKAIEDPEEDVGALSFIIAIYRSSLYVLIASFICRKSQMT